MLASGKENSSYPLKQKSSTESDSRCSGELEKPAVLDRLLTPARKQEEIFMTSSHITSPTSFIQTVRRAWETCYAFLVGETHCR